MNKLRFLLLAGMLALLTSCPGDEKSRLYRDDEGNYLEAACDKRPECNNNYAVIITETLDSSGNPNLNKKYDFVFCCDTVMTVADTIKKYAKKMSEYYQQWYGKKLSSRESASLFFTDFRRLWVYNQSQDAIFLKARFDSISPGTFQADSIRLCIIADNGFGICFKTEKTAGAFADTLKNVAAACCHP